jgi:hypothetical protein
MHNSASWNFTGEKLDLCSKLKLCAPFFITAYALKAVIVNHAEFNPQLMTAWMSKKLKQTSQKNIIHRTLFHPDF